MFKDSDLLILGLRYFILRKSNQAREQYRNESATNKLGDVEWIPSVQPEKFKCFNKNNEILAVCEDMVICC